jgi:hypothetical protein
MEVNSREICWRSTPFRAISVNSKSARATAIRAATGEGAPLPQTLVIGDPRLHGTHSGDIPEGPGGGGGTSSGGAGACGSNGAVPAEPPTSNLAAYRRKPRKPVAGKMSTERMPTAMRAAASSGTIRWAETPISAITTMRGRPVAEKSARGSTDPWVGTCGTQTGPAIP